MVNYGCGICGNKYATFDEAEKCEKKGLVGITLKPGLLLSHKTVDDGFLIFYNEEKPKGHERTYHFEEIISNDVQTYGLQDFAIPSSKLKRWIAPYNPSTKEELDRFNKLIKEDVPGIRGIEVYMENFNIKELHNECNPDDLLQVQSE